jgi:hypothetical protein
MLGYNEGVRIIEKHYKKAQAHVKRYGYHENEGNTFERNSYDALIAAGFNGQDCYATFSKLMETVYRLSNEL